MAKVAQTRCGTTFIFIKSEEISVHGTFCVFQKLYRQFKAWLNAMP